MTLARLRRLFPREAGSKVVVALEGVGSRDFGTDFLPGEVSFEAGGLSSIALRLSLGQASCLEAREVGSETGPLVIWLNVTNAFQMPRPSACFTRTVENAVEEALRLDAAAVSLSLWQWTGDDGFLPQCREQLAKVVPRCARFGLPVLVDIAAWRADHEGRPQRDPASEAVVPLVEEAVRSGADLLAVDAVDFGPVVAAAGRTPVLAHLALNANALNTKARAEACRAAGAAGLLVHLEHPADAAAQAELRALLERPPI